MSFKGQAGVDMIDIEEEGSFVRISSVFRESIDDIKAFSRSTTLAWTHSSFCNRSFEVFPHFDKKICVVRDPRDRALSSAKFAFTPYMLRHYPSSYTSPDAYLEGEFERLLDQWTWHTGNYLLYKKELNLHFVFYENLLLDFEPELQKLLDYLKISLSEKAQKEIAEEVRFSTMKDKSPRHLQKGSYGKWENQLSPSQKKTAVERAGKLMQILNYPLENLSEQKNLPSVLNEPHRQKLQEILHQMNWKELFPEKV